jgi:hypothetical protein
MGKKNTLIRIFTGTELLVLSLKNELEEIGVSSLIQDDYKSGMAAGVISGIPSAIDLLIAESDLKKAEPIIREFIRDNKK